MITNRQHLYLLALRLYNSGSGAVRSQQLEPPQKTDSQDTLERKFRELLVYNLAATTLGQLKAWAISASFSIASAAVYDEEGLLTSANVVWPDGSSGVYTQLVKNGSFPATDSYEITHADSGLILRQPAVTRNGSGLVTVSPPIEVRESGSVLWPFGVLPIWASLS